MKTPAKNVSEWTSEDVSTWLEEIGQGRFSYLFREVHDIDGKALLTLREEDLKSSVMNIKKIGEIKRLYISIKQLQRDNIPLLFELGHLDLFSSSNFYTQQRPEVIKKALKNCEHFLPFVRVRIPFQIPSGGGTNNEGSLEHEFYSASVSEDGHASHLSPEIWKTFISLAYLFIVTWITAFVMVIVHDRVPDMKKYPPLPDIFLDNVPHIPWAFDMCEVTGTLLFAIWLVVLVFHKYR